jgi:hypothetical protein
LAERKETSRVGRRRGSFRGGIRIRQASRKRVGDPSTRGLFRHWRSRSLPSVGSGTRSWSGQLALSLDATPPGTYRQRGTSSLQRLFRAHFPELVVRYDSDFARQLGKFRLERVSNAVERFLACGDCRRGIARITCTNPDSGLEYFRSFSCSVFHPLGGPLHRLCPSCSQKRTLLLGEFGRRARKMCSGGS